MMRRIYILMIGLSGVLCAFSEGTNNIASAAQTNSAPAVASINGASFEKFKIITQRNIFDPNRSAPGQPRRNVETPKPKRVEYLNLVGAMSYEKGRFAFFDGSSSEYRKSVKPGDSIAGYRVAEVTPNQVSLQNGDKKLDLPVGGQLKREDDGEWRVNSTPELFGNANSSSDSPASTNSPSSSTESSPGRSSDDVNPILRRLLEQRRQGN